MEETLRREAHGSNLATAAVSVTEGDEAAVVVEDTLGTEGGTIQVSGEVLQCRFASADRSHIGHPIHRPDWAGDLEEELGMVLLEGLLEPCAQAHRQRSLGQEVGGVFGTQPAQAIDGETAGGHHAMNVRMKAQVPCPGLKHRQQAELGAQIFVVTTDVEQSPGTVSEQEVVEELLVGADEDAQLSGDGEGNQRIRQGQEAAALSLQPRGGIGVATLRTGPMVAGVRGKVVLAAVATEQLAAQCGSTATDKGGDGVSMRGEQAGAKLPLIGRPVPAQDFGQWDQKAGAIRI